MRLIHNKGFLVSERKQWKVTIFQNLLHAFQVVFGAMEEQEVDFAEESNIVGHSYSAFWLHISDFVTEIRRGGSSRSGHRSRRTNAFRLSECFQELMDG